jgi:uncharacterized membrane protein
MNSLDWFAQILFGCVFLLDGLRRVFRISSGFEPEQNATQGQCIGMSRGATLVIGLAEMGGALGLLVPTHSALANILPLLAAVELAVLSLLVAICYVRRKIATGPIIALFLFAMFIVVGRIA